MILFCRNSRARHSSETSLQNVISGYSILHMIIRFSASQVFLFASWIHARERTGARIIKDNTRNERYRCRSSSKSNDISRNSWLTVSRYNSRYKNLILFFQQQWLSAPLYLILSITSSQTIQFTYCLNSILKTCNDTLPVNFPWQSRVP